MKKSYYAYALIKAGLSCLLLALLVGLLSLPVQGATITGDPIKVELFPNPAQDHLSVNISESGFMQIEVYSIIGNQMNVSSVKTGSSQYRVDISTLPAGYYLLMVKPVGESAQTIKFEKK